MIKIQNILDLEIRNLDFADNSQLCPQCGSLMGVLAGGKEAICKNCGFKDPCCE